MNISAFTVCLGLTLTFCIQVCCGNYPLLDVDTNMRIVLVPQDTPVGSIIYRLRASDSDHHFPLTFDVLGGIGKTLIDLEFLGCSLPESLCQADVILKKPLDIGRTYDFQIRVTDTTGDFTRVQAVITSTDGKALVDSNMLGGKILRVSEDTKIGAELEKFIVSKNELNTRPVLLEIREPMNRIELKQKLLSNNRTEGSLYLKKELDFEKEPWFTFQLLALNGHTNTTVDTRNVLVSEIAVLVTDVQDMPPHFITPMGFVEISSRLKQGDLIMRVQAEDGDTENKRLIRYGLLSDSNPFVTFFDLNSMTGEIRLKRNLTELFHMTKPNEPIQISVIAEEIIPENEKYGKFASNNLTSTIANLTFWYGEDISIGPPIFSFDKYFGEVKENSPNGTPVNFSFETRVWMSNMDSIIELDFSQSYENFGFTISPKKGKGNITFRIIVADSTLHDYEKVQFFNLHLKASTTSGSSSIVPMEIRLIDVNDNSPIFSQKEYVVEINEMAPYGTKVLQINASDKDSGYFGQVVYTNLIGSDAFRINSETGMITVEKSMELDRETQSEIRLYVEAKDGGLVESNDPDFVRNVATATVIVKLRDVNEPPECESKSYQAILSPELDSLKWPVYVKAIDTDSVGPNSEVRYQIVGDNRFTIDSVSGQIHLKFPVRLSPKDLESTYLGSFKVRAYDLGFPQLSTDCTVQLYSEDVVSQEIGFLFPSSPEHINQERDRIEKMLSQFTGGHASIITVSPLDPSKSYSAPPPQLIDKRILGPESRNAALRDEKSQKQTAASSSDQSVVLVSVQTPLSSRTRYVDLGSLKDFMLTDQIVDVTSTPQTSPEVSGAESRTLFWLLIALIILLLLLFLLFLCCLFCPCCYLFRNGRKSEISEKHTTREEFVESRGPTRRTRKTHPVRVADSADEIDYGMNYPTREAWSGDNRRWRASRQPRRGVGGGGRVMARGDRMPPQSGAEDVVVEDWEFAESALPVQYQQEESRLEELGPRWQMMQQQQQQEQYQPDQQRRRVAYAGHPHPGDEDFVRHQVQIDQYRGSVPPASYGYRSGEAEQAAERRQVRQRSPTRSLPPVQYREDSTRQIPTRFYKTTEGEVLQLDYDGDGDEGKEMLMRRFISEQHPQGERSPPDETSARESFRQRQATPPAKLSQKRNVGGIVEGFDPDSYQIEQETVHSRPKAASIMRRQNVAFEGLPTSREIDKIDEEDELQVPIPGAVTTKKDEKAKASKSTGKDHHHHKRGHKEKDKGKHDKGKSRRRSRSRERKTSGKTKTKSHSKSPVPEKYLTEPKSREESKSRSHSRSPSPSTSRAKLGKDNQDLLKPGNVVPLQHPIPPESNIEEQNREVIINTRESQPPETIPIEIISPSTAKSSTVERPSIQPQPDLGTSTTIQDNLESLVREEDEDSGIGLIGIANKRSKMLEKKSVFTIAYDEMASQNVLRPDTGLNHQDLELS